MSVLRNRSAWVIPAVSLLGVMTLGLAGCGGDDDTPFPPPSNNNPRQFTVVAPIPVTAQQTLTIPAGGSGTLTATQQDPSQSGVESIQVSIPTGAFTAQTSLGLAVIPETQSTVNRTRAAAPNNIGGVENIVEFALGTVGANNTISTINPIGMENPATITVQLTPAQVTEALAQSTGNRQLAVYQVTGQGTGVTQLTPVPGATVTLNPSTRTLTISGVRSTGILSVLGLPIQHFQGG